MTTVATSTTSLLSDSWLAARWGIDPALVDAMRRDGQLIAVRPEGSSHWQYPAWQFEHGRSRTGVERIVAAARDAHVDEGRLYSILTTPLGLGRGGKRLCDLLAEGRVDDVVAAVRSAS